MTRGWWPELNRSSRQIERTCRGDVAFKVITAMEVPDHSTVAEFRRRHQDRIAELLVEVLALCQEAGLVRGSRRSRSTGRRGARGRPMTATAATRRSWRRSSTKPNRLIVPRTSVPGMGVAMSCVSSSAPGRHVARRCKQRGNGYRPSERPRQEAGEEVAPAGGCATVGGSATHPRRSRWWRRGRSTRPTQTPE